MVKSIGGDFLRLQNKITVVLGEGPLFNYCVKELSKKFENVYCLNNSGNKNRNVKKTNLIKIKKFQKIDFLFSIMNKNIIKNEILDKTSYAINFHDAPLPKYAGLNSSTFGILNDEKNWGCTWHIMDEKLDKGDILFQKKFKIGPDNTAYDIDVQSQFHGHLLFQKIIKNLDKLNKFRKKQNTKEYSYYGKKQFNLIPNRGIVKLSYNFQKIYKIYRALKLSKEKTNLLFSPKIEIRDKIFILKQINLRNFDIKKKNQSVNLHKFKIKNKKFVIKKNGNYYQFFLGKKLNIKKQK